MIIAELTDKLSEDDGGDGGEHITHMVWADNFHLIVDSEDTANQMLQDLTRVLHKYRMQWKPESKQCLAGGCLVNTQITLRLQGKPATWHR